MSITTLLPSSDLSDGSAWSKNGFTGSYSSALAAGNTSSYGSVSSSAATGALELTLESLPAGVSEITAVSIYLICAVSSTKSISEIQSRVYNSSGSSELVSTLQFTPTTSFTTITLTGTLNDGTPGDWSGAYILIADNGDGQSNTLKVCGAGVNVTYTPSSTDVGGTGGCGEDASFMFGSILHHGAQLIAY